MSYRYNLDLPDELRAELAKDAAARGISVAELLRKFIRLGLLAIDVEADPRSMLVIKEGDRERQLVLV